MYETRMVAMFVRGTLYISFENQLYDHKKFATNWQINLTKV
jgi:hypothetical protein